MELSDIIKTCGDYGLAVILALVVIWWNRKDTKEYADREREDKLLLVRTLQDVSIVLSEVKTVVGELKVLVQRLNGKA